MKTDRDFFKFLLQILNKLCIMSKKSYGGMVTMNYRMKILSVFMAMLMMLAVIPLSASAEEKTLQFGEDGKFTIMMFADIQDDQDVEETTIALMNDSLDKYKPDLVIYLGDNTVAKGYDNQKKAIEVITEPCVSRDVPYAIVFGNHDQEQGVTKEKLLEIYQSFGCLTTDADPAIYGCGSCNLPILSSDGTKTAFNLWLMDSGSRNPDKSVGGYDYVRKDQIEWYEKTAAALKAENGGETVPSINFQHIIVPEVYEAMYPPLPFKGLKDTTYKGTTYLPVPYFSAHKGMIFEPPCPPYVTDGQFDSWLKTGDVIATFHGHDHINYFTTNYQGIDINCVPSVGCNSYHNELVRGVGLLTIDENNPKDYSYELIHMFDMAVAEDSTILAAQGAKIKPFYYLVKAVYTLFDKIHILFS